MRGKAKSRMTKLFYKVILFMFKKKGEKSPRPFVDLVCGAKLRLFELRQWAFHKKRNKVKKRKKSIFKLNLFSANSVSSIKRTNFKKNFRHLCVGFSSLTTSLLLSLFRHRFVIFLLSSKWKILCLSRVSLPGTWPSYWIQINSGYYLTI